MVVAWVLLCGFHSVQGGCSSVLKVAIMFRVVVRVLLGLCIKGKGMEKDHIIHYSLIISKEKLSASTQYFQNIPDGGL